MEYRRLGDEIVKKTKEEWDVIDDANKTLPTYSQLRNKERGTVQEQLEIIAEQGVQAFIDRDKNIRDKYPKTKNLEM